MKKLVFCALALCGSGAVAQAQEVVRIVPQAKVIDESRAADYQFVQGFYQAYTGAVLYDNTFTVAEALREKFCTPYCLQQIKEKDYDFLLNAQDFTEEWRRTMKVKRSDKSTFVVTYTYDGRGGKKKTCFLYVYTLMKDGRYLIDNVIPAEVIGDNNDEPFRRE